MRIEIGSYQYLLNNGRMLVVKGNKEETVTDPKELASAVYILLERLKAGARIAKKEWNELVKETMERSKT